MALIHLDAGVLIGFLDGDDAHHPAARDLLSAALDGADVLVTTDRGWPSSRALEPPLRVQHL